MKQKISTRSIVAVGVVPAVIAAIFADIGSYMVPGADHTSDIWQSRWPDMCWDGSGDWVLLVYMYCWGGGFRSLQI